jgi:hypothetical protein
MLIVIAVLLLLILFAVSGPKNSLVLVIAAGLLFAAIMAHSAHAAEANNSATFRLRGCDLTERAVSGQRLTETEAMQAGFCFGSVNATMYILDQLKLVCFPENGNVGIYIKVVRKYLKDNPKALAEDWDEALAFAAAEAWPCPKEKGS